MSMSSGDTHQVDATEAGSEEGACSADPLELGVIDTVERLHIGSIGVLHLDRHALAVVVDVEVDLLGPGADPSTDHRASAGHEVPVSDPLAAFARIPMRS